MKLEGGLKAKVQAYLDAVAAQTAGRGEAARRELLQDLERHILESLERAGEGDPTPERLDAVLASMDPPESYGAGAEETTAASAAAGAGCCGGPAAARRGRGADRWFLLALAFLCVNAWGVWRIAGRRAAEAAPAVVFSAEEGVALTNKAPLVWTFTSAMRPPAGGLPPVAFRPPLTGLFEWRTTRELTFAPSQPWTAGRAYEAELSDLLVSESGSPVGERLRRSRFRTAPLALLGAVRKSVEPDRSLVLELRFNAPVRPAVAEDYVRLQLPGGKQTVSCRRIGDAVSSAVLLRTGPVMRDSAVLTVRRGLPPAEGEIGLAEEWSQEIAATTERLTFHRLRPASPAFEPCSVQVLFDDVIDPATAAGRIAIDPAVKVTSQQLDGWQDKGLALSGEFEPGRTYRLTLRAGLAGIGGARLPEDVTRTVLIPDRERSIAIAEEGQYLSPAGALTVPLSLMNVRKCDVYARPIPPQNLVFHAMREASRYSHHYGSDPDDHAEGLTAPAVKKTYELSDVRNREQRLAVRLPDLVEGAPRGAYLVSVESPNLRSAHRVVYVTDLGLSARIAGHQALVWVNSLRTAKAAAGAEVVLYGQNNLPLAHGVTDADGTALLTFAPPAPESAPFLVTAALGPDLSCLSLHGTEVAEDAEGVPSGRAFLADRNEACVFTDRGVYRPGETVHAKALVRNRALEAPAAFPVVFRVVKPDGRLFREIPAMLDARGAAECEVRIPDYLPTGRHQVELSLPGTGTPLGSTTVAVEDFVPPQIEVKVVPPAGRVPASEAVAFTVKARHLFGRPAAGLSLTAGITFKPVAFASVRWPGYRFGDDTRPFERVYQPLGQEALDDEGAASFEKSAEAEWRPPAALEAVMGATVMEPNGRTVTASTSVPVDLYPHYIGLKPSREGGHLRVGERAGVAVAVVRPDGAATDPGAPLKVVLASQKWVSALRRDPDGTYRYRSDRVTTVVREDTVRTAKGVADYAFTLPASGEYVLTVRDPVSDSAGSLHLFAAAADETWVDWSKENPESVGLSADREIYAPGDRAKLSIQAPFAGQALLTVETDRVLERRRIELGQNTREVEIELGAEHVPNVYCSVTMLRPAVAESVWSAHRAAGRVSLKVQPKGRRLDVQVEAPAVARPQAKMTAKLRVKDADGRGAAGEVVVAAVDEGILFLTDFATPDPLKHFLAERAPGVQPYDLYGLLMPEAADAAGAGAAKNGGDEESSLRRRLNPIRASRFRPVALWASRIETGTNGEAEVSFDVPEFTGRLRLMAVAFDRARAGNGEARVEVKRPLVVQPALPRFLTSGDRCRMGVQVFNETGADREVAVRVTCGGPLKVEVPDQAFALKAGAGRMAWFDLEAGAAPGRAVCTVEASAGGERYSEAIELAVRPAAARVTAASFGAVEPGAEVRLAPSAGWLPQTAEIELWASGRPGVENLGALDRLLTYPHGCVEQTTSQLLPLLHLADLANEALPGSMRGGDAAQFVRAGILRLLSMQDGDGDFRVWPDTLHVDEWCSMYATFALVEARAAGYEVPADPLDAALDRVRGVLARDPPVLDEDPADPAGSASGWRDDMEKRAFACHILARAARPEPGWIARLEEQKGRLSYGARAHLAAALIYAGRPRDGGVLLAELGLPAPAERRRADAVFSSRERLAALALSSWLDVDPKNAAVPALAGALDSLRTGGTWATTHDNAWALFALGKYARLTRDTPTEFRAQCVPDGGAPADFASGRTFRWASREPGATPAVRLVNRGPGRCFYGVRVAGVPADGRVAEGDWGMAVRRQWLTAEGQPWPADRKPKQGDLVVVKLSLRADSGTENVVVEDLLPAGFEIENPALGTAQVLPWVQEKSEWCVHREIRDDRLVLFAARTGAAADYYYAARVVTPGRFVLPPVTAEAMYDPSLHSAHGRGTVEIGE